MYIVIYLLDKGQWTETLIVIKLQLFKKDLVSVRTFKLDTFLVRYLINIDKTTSDMILFNDTVQIL